MYSEDIKKVGEFIASHHPDIICLQELTKGYHSTNSGTGEQLAKMLGYSAFCSYGPMILPDGTQTLMGNGILSRKPLVHTKEHVIQKGKVIDDKVLIDERYYLEASITVAGREITIGTTHLPFHPRFKTTPHKQKLVEEVISHIPPHKPYILAGDFNSIPQSIAAKTFRQHGLKNAGPAFHRKTWTTKPFSIGEWSYNELSWRLDYVLYQGAIKPIKSYVLTTALSDHLPILVEFEI